MVLWTVDNRQVFAGSATKPAGCHPGWGGGGGGSHTKCRGGEVRRTSIGVKILGFGTAWGVQRKHNT